MCRENLAWSVDRLGRRLPEISRPPSPAAARDEEEGKTLKVEAVYLMAFETWPAVFRALRRTAQPARYKLRSRRPLPHHSKT
jgi:hypothetical protein